MNLGILVIIIGVLIIGWSVVSGIKGVIEGDTELMIRPIFGVVGVMITFIGLNMAIL